MKEFWGRIDRGGEGTKPPPPTQATETIRTRCGDEGMTRRPGTAAAPILHWGMTADEDSVGPLKRHTVGADGDRPQNGMQLCCKYGSMAPEEPADNPAAAETQIRGAGHRATRGTKEQGKTMT